MTSRLQQQNCNLIITALHYYRNSEKFALWNITSITIETRDDYYVVRLLLNNGPLTKELQIQAFKDGSLGAITEVPKSQLKDLLYNSLKPTT